MKKYISIDIGGTAIKYGIICENAEIMMKETMKTEAEKGGSAILEKSFCNCRKTTRTNSGKSFWNLHFNGRNG